MGSQFSMHIIQNRRKELLTSKQQRKSKSMATDVKTKFAEDMRRLTNAASRWKLGRKKDKVAQTKDTVPAVTDSFKMSPPAKPTSPSHEQTKTEKPVKATPAQALKAELLPNKVSIPTRGLPQHIIAATRVSERKWTLSDLLHSFGTFVQNNCGNLHNIPTPNEVAMWVRCADRALQLNGWTINSFLLESHVVFTYMLVASAIQQGYELYSLTDVKELVLMCLYVSYTYNANEISYPLRPFLVRHDRVSFWDKCTSVSLNASSNMLKLNRDRSYYSEVLTSLKKICPLA